jgi:transcriptional regulator with XRE-family HTH domain
MSNDFYRQLGALLVKLREDRGLSLAEAATMLGIDRSTLRKYEKGLRQLHAQTLFKILGGYNLSLAVLDTLVKQARGNRDLVESTPPRARRRRWIGARTRRALDEVIVELRYARDEQRGGNDL